MNSPSTHVAVMYPSDSNDARTPKPATQHPTTSLLPSPPAKFEPNPSLPSPSPFTTFDATAMPPPPDPVLVSDADLLLNLHTPFPTDPLTPSLHPYPATSPSLPHPHLQNHASIAPPGFPSLHNPPAHASFGDMVIDTQDVDMSVLGAEMMPWDLEYLPHDVFYFGGDDGGGGGGGVFQGG